MMILQEYRLTLTLNQVKAPFRHHLALSRNGQPRKNISWRNTCTAERHDQTKLDFDGTGQSFKGKEGATEDAGEETVDGVFTGHGEVSHPLGMIEGFVDSGIVIAVSRACTKIETGIRTTIQERNYPWEIVSSSIPSRSGISAACDMSNLDLV